MVYFQDMLKEQFGMEEDLIQLAAKVEEEVKPVFNRIENVSAANHVRVLQAFLQAGVADFHFQGSTGYGYGDLGRHTLDGLYADIFGGESAIVRTSIASGSHAIALCFFAVARPGEEILVVGDIYPTLRTVVGLDASPSGSLREWGVECRQVPLSSDPNEVLSNRTRAIFLQRSAGYSRGTPLGLDVMEQIIARYKKCNTKLAVIVDNCYGEFVEAQEPCHVGADLAAGSLIKNAGGGVAPCGGYVVGRRELVERAAARLTAPGLGTEVGAEPAGHRLLFQGLFLAPSTVGEALKTAVFAARLFERLGFSVFPRYDGVRTDIVQAIDLGTPQRLLAFCRGVQRRSPVDSMSIPEPAYLPGYGGEVLMAAGTFVQGGSLELSADAPWEPPYTAYIQGGLSFRYGQIGVLSAAQDVIRKDQSPGAAGPKSIPVASLQDNRPV